MLSILSLYSRASLRADDGATAVEYGLMLGLIALVIFAAVGFLGTAVSDLFSRFLEAHPFG